jgi:excisionase family DNA binding protein
MRYYTTSQAAVELGVTPRRVLALIDSGRLKAARAGSFWLIAPSHLEAVRSRPPGRPRKKSRRRPPKSA